MKKLLLLFCIVLLLADYAAACGRCGLFGLRCRFSSHKKVAVAQAVIPPQTIIVNNPPASPVIVQGGSAYGYGQQQPSYQQQTSQYAALDPAAFLNQAARLVEGGQDVARLAFSQYATVGDNQLKNQTAVAALLAAREGPNVNALREALRASDTPAPSSIRLELSSGGKWEVKQGKPPEAVTAGGDFPLLKQNCASCHSGAAPKGGLTIDGTAQFNVDQFKNIREQVFSGKMPKAAEGGQPIQLAPELRKAIVGEAALLLNGN